LTGTLSPLRRTGDPTLDANFAAIQRVWSQLNGGLEYVWPTEYPSEDLPMVVSPSGVVTQGAISASALTENALGLSTDMIFAANDYQTVGWSAATVTFANGTTYSINANNTGAMSALTYIYLDVDTSSTELQVSTTFSDCVGDRKALMCIAKNAPAADEDPFFVPRVGEVMIGSGNISAKGIKAAQIDVISLSSIVADFGEVIAGVARDGSSTFVVDFNNALITVKDTQGSPVDRVYLGKLGAGAEDYGIEVYDTSGNLILGATGLGTNVVNTTQIVANAVTATEVDSTAVLTIAATVATDVATGPTALTGVLDHDGTDARLITRGADASTQGGLKIYSTYSDGASGVVRLELDPDGTWDFNSNALTSIGAIGCASIVATGSIQAGTGLTVTSGTAALPAITGTTGIYTGGQQITVANSHIRIIDLNGAANNTRWLVDTYQEDFRILTENDAATDWEIAMLISRTGIVVDSITFFSTASVSMGDLTALSAIVTSTATGVQASGVMDYDGTHMRFYFYATEDDGQNTVLRAECTPTGSWDFQGGAILGIGAATLDSLQVDNININGNTISSTAGTDLLITPLAGQQIVLDGTVVIDAGVVTGATSISSTSFVGALTGNASTATALETARTINSVSFDGTANITVTAAAGTLTGTTLKSTVVTSSLTTVGVLASGSIASGFGNIDNAANTLTTGALTATTGTFSGVLSVDDTTDTSSGTTGSIHTDGGVGVAKKLWVGTGATISTGGLTVSAGTTAVQALTATTARLSDKLTITRVSGHIDLVESDASNKTWRIEVQGSNYDITEVGVDTHFRMNPGGTATFLSNSVSMGALTATTGTFSGTCYIGDTANANATLGLTINQGAADNQILTGKSSDVVTGLTSALVGAIDVETDDFFTLHKTVAGTSGGGLTLISLMENVAQTNALRIESYGGQADTTKSTAGRALIEFYAAQHDGANALADIAADGNLAAFIGRVGSANVARWILDEDGDTWQAGAATILGDLDHDGSNVGFYATAPVAQAGAITKPSGGVTVDAEARTAIDAIIDALGATSGVGLTA
jgi:hypothetical protein